MNRGRLLYTMLTSKCENRNVYPLTLGEICTSVNGVIISVLSIITIIVSSIIIIVFFNII